MKIKFAALFLILTVLGAVGEEAPLVAKRQPGEAGTLTKPYQGILLPDSNFSGSTDRREVPMLLNYFIPPGKATGNPTNSVPYLATTEDGVDYWNAHAYRNSLRSQEELASLETYEDYIATLGQPIEPPSGLKKEGDWFYDTVVWRLFTPADGTNVSIMHVTLRRKWRRDLESENPDQESRIYQLESVSVRGGLFQPRTMGTIGIGPPFLTPELLIQGSSTLLLNSPVVSPD